MTLANRSRAAGVQVPHAELAVETVGSQRIILRRDRDAADTGTVLAENAGFACVNIPQAHGLVPTSGREMFTVSEPRD